MTPPNQGELILYRTEDGMAEVQLRAVDGTVWLTQAQMAELFDTSKQNISLHIKNILEEAELFEAATVKEFLTVQNEGPRPVQRSVLFYNLELILAVGYRVRSARGSQFRRWAGAAYFVRGGDRVAKGKKTGMNGIALNTRQFNLAISSESRKTSETTDRRRSRNQVCRSY